MSRQINKPSNQVRLTNVAVVRMNKSGKRFEIACYRNKVVDYRQGLEQDLSEVLQTERVFTNVSKGEFAKAKDLQKAFGTKDEEEIAKLILTKGQVQVSDKERSQQLEKTNAQIAEWISKNCVHPTSDRPYTISQIRHAMQQANFSVHPTKPLKRQYLDCVKMLQGIIPIQRAKMELLLLVPAGQQDDVESAMKDNGVSWESRDSVGEDEAQCQYRILVDPSLYRILNETIQAIAGARIEVVTQVVTKQGDVNLEEVGTSGTVDDAFDSGVGAITPAMEGLDIQQSANGPDDIEDNTGDDDSEEDLTANRRKQQKKAKKKNKKAQRRVDTTTTVSSPTQTQQPNQVMSSGVVAPAATSDNGGGKSCNTCGGSFETPAAYRAHFKSDWHRFNQKLKLKGAAPISEQEFQLCDSDTFFGGDDLL